MQAAVISSFGPPEVLVAADVAEPEAGPGDVVLGVQVASITFVETQLRNGTPPHAAMATRAAGDPRQRRRRPRRGGRRRGRSGARRS